MINLVYALDKKIFDGLILSVCSVARRTSRPLSIYLLTMSIKTDKKEYFGLQEEHRVVIEKVVKKYHPQSTVRLIEMKDIYQKTMANGANKNTMYSPYTLLRLLLGSVPNIPDKMLYLDVDTMVNQDISILYDKDISNYEYAASLDAIGHYWMGKTYINAGVLLLNIKKIKENKLFEKCIDYLMVNKKVFPDQTALNKCCTAKLVLEPRFNEQRKMKKDTVVKHFCKVTHFFPYIRMLNIKQWEIEDVHKKLKIFDFDEDFNEFYEFQKTQEYLNIKE